MITRRQWAGSARVLQVLNLIGPEGPIAPGGTSREEPQGQEPRAGTQGRNPGQEPRAGTPGAGTQGRNPGQEPQGGRKYQAHRPHSTTAPQAPQPHSTTGPTATVHSVLTASLLSHHPSPFNFHIKHSKHKRKTMRN